MSQTFSSIFKNTSNCVVVKNSQGQTIYTNNKINSYYLTEDYQDSEVYLINGKYYKINAQAYVNEKEKYQILSFIDITKSIKEVASNNLEENVNHEDIKDYYQYFKRSNKGKFMIFGIVNIVDLKNTSAVYGKQNAGIVEKSVLEIIKSYLSKNNFIARYSYEELIIMMPSSMEELKPSLDKLNAFLKEIDEKIFISNNELFHIVVSIGLSIWSKNAKYDTVYEASRKSLDVALEEPTSNIGIYENDENIKLYRLPPKTRRNK